MKTIQSLIFFTFIIALSSCSSNDDIEAIPGSVTFNFTHSWQDLEIDTDEFNILQYETENGDSLLITRLRYLVSDFVFTHESGTTLTIDDYQLIDVTNGENLSFSTQDTILPGTYSISFRFGLLDEKNQGATYEDLIGVNFDVPPTLGGGYHYMQFDGEYLDENDDRQPFNYHAISAIDPLGVNEAADTSFEVELGAVVIGGNTTVNINMDVYEWFSNPNMWDLNELNVMLMGNFEAQIDINQNGASVFSLGTVTQ
jgi:hypothetical protein